MNVVMDPLDEFMFVTQLLQPPPEVVTRVRELESERGRRGSVVGRRQKRWRSEEFLCTLHLLDDVQWRRTFRVSRRVFARVLARTKRKLERPGNNGTGTAEKV